MGANDTLRLENEFCFPLYASARESVKAYRPFLDAIGLTYTQYITMLVLWQVSPVSVKDLGARLYLDSGTLTPVLKSMERDGLLRRCRSDADERVVLVSLTDEGRALREKASSVPESLAPHMPLSPDETAALHRLLYQLLDHYNV